MAHTWTGLVLRFRNTHHELHPDLALLHLHVHLVCFKQQGGLCQRLGLALIQLQLILCTAPLSVCSVTSRHALHGLCGCAGAQHVASQTVWKRGV